MPHALHTPKDASRTTLARERGALYLGFHPGGPKPQTPPGIGLEYFLFLNFHRHKIPESEPGLVLQRNFGALFRAVASSFMASNVAGAGVTELATAVETAANVA